MVESQLLVIAAGDFDKVEALFFQKNGDFLSVFRPQTALLKLDRIELDADDKACGHGDLVSKPFEIFETSRMAS